LQKVCDLGTAAYLKAGIYRSAVADDSSDVNVHGTMPALWVKLAMLLLNLVVWINAAVRLAA
jgi:hypothetical protein